MSKRTCIVVLGMHRSGTSALAGLLSLLGAHAGTDLMPTTEFNPKGYWELQPVFDLNDLLLAKLDRRWHDVAPLPPDWRSHPAILESQSRAEAIIAREFSASKLCVLKDPRLCMLLPFWTDCLATAGFECKHIVMVRSPEEIAASLTLRDQFSSDKCAWLWLRYMFDAERSTRGKPRLFLSFDDLLEDWRSAAAKASKRFNLKLAITPGIAKAVEGFLDPQLRHFRGTDARRPEIVTNDGTLSEFCVSTYNLLRDAVGRDLSRRQLVALDDLRGRFETWSADHIVAEVQREHAWTRSVMFGLNDRVNAMQTEASTANERIASQRARLEELELAREVDAALLGESQQRNEALATELSILTQRNAAEAERAGAHNAELKTKLDESNEHRENLEARLSFAKEQINVLEDRLDESTEHRGNLEEQLSLAKEQINMLEDRRVTLTEQRDDLESRLYAMTDHSESMEGALRESLAFHRKLVAISKPRGIASAIVPRNQAALEGVRFACEQPESEELLTGVIEIAGWCFGTTSLVVGVEVLWNGTLLMAQYGGPRGDVGLAYPQHHGAAASAFRCRLEAPPGDYFLSIVALCDSGNRVRLADGVISVRPHALLRSLDTPRRARLSAGITRFAGWCFSRDEAIASLVLRVGETTYPCTYGIERADVAKSFPEVTHAGRSGFEAYIPLTAGLVDISMEAALESGERIVETMATGIRVRRAWGFKRALHRALEHIERARHTGRRAARWVRRQRRLPRWHELPLLLRKARAQLRASPSGEELPTPAGWSLPPIADPYDVWLENNAVTLRSARALCERLDSVTSKRPLISVVMPVFNPDLELLERAINSVKDQMLTEWELCIADDCSSNANVRSLLQTVASHDSRIKVTFREVNGNISAATNSAASLARGTFVLFLDQDDELSPDALGEITLHLAEHPDTDLLYSDDDKIDSAGHRFAPQFKPDWSPELLLSYMYMGHALVVRRELLEQLGGFRTGFEGSQDYDFALRASEEARRVGHVPRVLYHWRATRGSTATNANTKPAGFSAGQRAVQEALIRRHSSGRAVRPNWAQRDRLSLYWHDFGDEGPQVTIIIPTRNNHDKLRRCIDSLAATTYKNFEIMVVDSASDEAATLAHLRALPHRVLNLPNTNGRFNLASINNQAAAAAGGELLLFLSDDTEALEPCWLSRMVGYAQLTGVGAVGARLIYPDGRTQHAGIVHGLYDGLAGPAFKLMPQTDHGYLYYAMVARNYSAVSAACLLTPRILFDAVGGFDEQTFPVAYHDVDYCYRLVDAGYRCVYAPGAKLLHHESYSRSLNDRPQEVAAFRAKYRDRNDPYYSPNLSDENEQFAISSRRLPNFFQHQPPARALMCAFTLNLEGAPYSQFELTLALKQAGVIDPIVYAPEEGPLRVEYERNGIPVHIFDHPLRGAGTPAEYDEAIAKFSRWVKAQGTEVLYANTMESFYAIAAARHGNVPSIWNIRESEPWQTYFRHLSHEIAARALDCFAYPYRVIFVAHATRERYAALATRHQFTVIHNGLNLERLSAEARRWPRPQARAQLGLAEDETMLLLLGTVCERKGQMDLVEALALLDARQIAKCCCFIVGDRPSSYSTRLNLRARELAQERGLRVTIVPETQDTALYYSAADIFICTSRVESYPRVILEAMAYGLPIVTTPVFGVREQVKPEVNGLFYEPADIAGLRAALDRLMTDGKLRRQFAENAAAVLATLTSFEEMIARYGRIFVEAAECQPTSLSTEAMRLTIDAPQILEKTAPANVARHSASTEGQDSMQTFGN